MRLPRGKVSTACALGAFVLVASSCSSWRSMTQVSRVRDRAGGDVVVVEAAPDDRFRVAAPPGCSYQLHCFLGISRAYGVNLAADLRVMPEPSEAVRALRAGEIDLAVVPAFGDQVGDALSVQADQAAGVYVLRDDLGALVPDHLVLLHRRELGTLFGPVAELDLARVASSLTPALLRTVVADLPRASDPAVRSAWLALTGPPPAGTPPPGDVPVIVGSWAAVEHEAVAHLVLAALGQRGYAVSLAPPLPTRQDALEALAEGRIHVLPELVSSLLEHVNGAAGEASADAVATARRLAAYVGQAGIEVSSPSPASVTARFLVRRPELGPSVVTDLSQLGDLAQRIEVVRKPAPPPTTEVRLAVPLRLARPAALGGKGFEVEILQRRLAQLGFAVVPTGAFDAATLAAVQAVQAARGIPTSTIVDARTQAALDNASPPGPRPAGGPVVHLTFDDGPDPRYTLEILDLLDSYGARATFFVVGDQAAAHPGILRAIVERGHVLGNHTYRHPDLRRASASHVRQELADTTAVIRAATGAAPACMRPPYGALDDEALAVIAELGLEPVLWHVDTEDWRGRSADVIAEHVVARAAPGAVVLLHDGGGDRVDTVRATAQLLGVLSMRGFQFEPIASC